MPHLVLGIDHLLQNATERKTLDGKRIGLLLHAASVTSTTQHTLDALMAIEDLDIACVFSPQHGLFSDKQDNMIETPHSRHPRYVLPVYSLYSGDRRPTEAMMRSFDVLIADLQGLGVRVYTYMTTLFYMIEACDRHEKQVWVLDRPNPLGRPVEGLILEKGLESFIGYAKMIMRHGMTIGELAKWFVKVKGLKLPLRLVEMLHYAPAVGPGYGWPSENLSWVNPSPNAPGLYMARCYPGTVLFEGTNLSEGRGTTRPFEMIGAPDIEFAKVLAIAKELAPQYFGGCTLRLCKFEPVVDKHASQLCNGIQIHVDNMHYEHHQFKPFRLCSALLKAIRLCYPTYDLWYRLPFEYEHHRLAIDLLTGSDFVRHWVDDPDAQIDELEGRLTTDESIWEKTRQPYLMY